MIIETFRYVLDKIEHGLYIKWGFFYTHTAMSALKFIKIDQDAHQETIQASALQGMVLGLFEGNVLNI